MTKLAILAVNFTKVQSLSVCLDGNYKFTNVELSSSQKLFMGGKGENYLRKYGMYVNSTEKRMYSVYQTEH